MKKLNSLNLGKSLNREEMKNISAGLVDYGKKCGACVSPYDCGSGCNACDISNSGSTGGKCYKIAF